MSRRRAGSLAVVFGLLGATDVVAQAPSLETDSLLARVKVLDSVMLVRGRAVDSVRRLLVRSLPPVDVRRGAIHARTEASLERRVRIAVDSTAALVDRPHSAVLTERLASLVATIVRDSTRSMFGMVPVIGIRADTTSRWSAVTAAQVRGPASAAGIANALAATVEQSAMHGADSALAAWVMLGRVPLRPAAATEAADAYMELATTESIVLRRCRAGDTSACLDALGVDSMPGARLARWYAPEDYRSALRATPPERHDSAAVAAWTRCRAEGTDADCRVAAQALSDARVALPLSAATRFTFLREVLAAGGPGALDRLFNTRGTVRDRLSAAAGEPLHATAQRWLARIEHARPDRMRVTPGLAFASLGWSAAVVALALTRRSSWA